MLKKFFHFTQREKYGLIVLASVVFTMVFCKYNFKAEPASVRKGKPIETLHQEFSSPNGDGNFQGNLQTEDRRTYFNFQEKEMQRQKMLKEKLSKKSNKFPLGTKVDINRADTDILVKIPGIGASYARRIVKYRDLLGGYYSVGQLKEIYDMYEELYVKIVPYFVVDGNCIRKIDVNRASLSEMNRHPYINFYQAKAIYDLRNRKGRLKNWSELKLMEEFDSLDLNRLKNYVSFE